MKKVSQRVITVLTALAAVVLMSGCGGGNGQDAGQSQQSTGGQAEAHLKFGCYNYSDSLDPATNINSSWCGVRYGITECLFQFNAEAAAEPNLCDSYTVSPDYLVWTLHIRDGVKFSNGKDVTPEAVKASLERLYRETDAAQGGSGNSLPQAYLTYDSITADDAAGTVTITCSAPTSNLPGILAYPYFAVIDAEAAAEEIVGTGPYKVTAHNAGTSIDLVRNDLYWQGEVPYDKVTILFIDDSSTKSMALQSGDIDLAENITTASDLEKLSADSKYKISTAAGVRTANSYINYDGVLANDSLRKAVLMALDGETMCRVTVAGMYTPGYSVLSSSLAYNYDQLSNPYPFDKQAAIDLLEEAGIIDTDGDGFRELDGEMINLDYVAYNSRNLNDFAEAAALQLAEIGIKSTVNIRDYDTAVALQSAGEFDLITANTLTVGVGDPQDYLGKWYSGNSSNFGQYQNDEYDRIYEQLMVELGNGRRTELITQLQQILIDDAATIVHGYYNSRMISNAERVDGAEIATMDYYWLTTKIKPVR